MKEVTEQFSNYPPFAYHFEPVAIVKTGRNEYTVYYGGFAPENQI